MKVWLQTLFGPRTSKPEAVPTSVAEPAKRAQAKDVVNAPLPSTDAGGVSLHDILHVVEVDDPRMLAGALFARRFAHPVPQIPRHFVAFYAPDSQTPPTVLGYIHQTPWQDSALCGGMVIDERAWRTVASHHRKIIRDAGGVAEQLLRQSFDKLGDVAAIWGMVGDVLAEKVDRRVGFERIDGEPYLMVIWRRPLSDEEKLARIGAVKALGAF